MFVFQIWSLTIKNNMKTNAMRILEQKKIPYQLYTYSNETALDGMSVAHILKKDENTVFKTLVTISKTNHYYVFMIPVCKTLDLKKAAFTVGEKSLNMLPSKELLPLTGYVHGGCSPIGMKKTFPTIIDQTVLNQSEILFSGGKIGYQLELRVEDFFKTNSVKIEDIVVEDTNESSISY